MKCSTPMHNKGIIVGCDRYQEGFLPWWWHHYARHNSYPVAFADFGMSSGALAWCKERGVCLASSSIALQEVSPENQHSWEHRYGEGIWSNRDVWFKKPSTLLLSPFAVSLWIDLDCKIQGHLEPLFASLSDEADIALAREDSPEINYNAGVIVFRRNAPILHQWAHLAATENASFPGDQNALCHAIEKHKPPLTELPPAYNWGRLRGPNENALIYHYTGGAGKLLILEEISDF